MSGAQRSRVAVVGGGISGLTAAYRLRTLLGPAAEIVLVEGSRRLGGALRTVELGGLALDVGAEAFLVRRPEALGLIEELGLGGQLTHPTPATPTVRAGGRTLPLPTRTVLGLPGAAADVAGLLSAQGAQRVAAEPTVPLCWEPGQDAAVGRLLRERAGDELVDRLVDPLLGGVYAGRADALGLRATLPAVATALDCGAGSLLAAAAAALPAGGLPPRGGRSPVFGTLLGGLSVLIDALVAAAAVRPWLGLPVRGLARTPDGWRLELGSSSHPEQLDVDAVVLAVPAPALRRLLVDPLPAASAAAGRVEVASSAVVGLALPLAAAQALPVASGVLVAAGESLSVKAFTFSGRKWAHASSDEVLLVRGSLGRHGETRVLQRDDAELVDAVRADLATVTGITAVPVDAVVARWGGGLPQYAPGHLDAVAALEREVDGVPGLAVAGATLHGVGVPACIGTADVAARRISAYLSNSGRPRALAAAPSGVQAHGGTMGS
ncbi:MAG TPA: protoporphyrinogen oxidase [Pseudonocardiaceae bacterium]|nr:protoporphyrinogen oxidase [Pseudonocardiaceae bacterium]